MTFDKWDSDFPYTPPEDVDWTSCGVRLGPDGINAVEVVWGSGGSGSKSTLRKVWKDRKGSRVNPVVAVHYTASQAIVMGPGREGASPSVDTIRDVDHLSRILDAALVLEDRHRARIFLQKYLSHAGSPTLGVHNSGLLSTHALHRVADEREDWDQLAISGKALLDQSPRKLMEGLGFQVEQSSQQHSILRVDGEAAAIALFLQPNENPDGWFSERFDSESPVLYALRMAGELDLEWVVIITKEPTVIRLYPTSTTVGVGRRGRTETFCEVRLDLLSDMNAGFLLLLFSSEALRPNGYLKDLIERSADHVAELGKRLRDRIYGNVLPRLATGIAEARELDAPTTKDLSETHDMALTLLFRLLFISYAEDRALLPYGENDEYTKVALKTLAKTFTPSEGNPEVQFDADSTELWSNVSSIVKAIHDGRDDWSIPAYGGTPFTEDENIKPSGARLAEIELDDSVFGPALQGLLIDRGTNDEIGPIDFRELSVREFGTIYEGLLESELALATEDLAEDNKGYYRPVSGNDTVVVEDGEFYLHNSGQRKSSASYYTKSFTVEHLLDQSLEPALNKHLARVAAIEDDAEASKLLFDFRIADISMGSGHFLIAAIDRIERRFSNFRAERRLLGVDEELNRLWKLAAERTGKDAKAMGIDENQILRRQIARRCVYGVDINPTAVELARVSVWVHTFVPGIPLSFLDWRLRCGNSILGVANQDEANSIIRKHGDQATLAAFLEQPDFQREVELIAKQMAEIAEGTDSSIEEVELAMQAYRDNLDRLAPYSALMDIICASRVDDKLAKSLSDVVNQWRNDPLSLCGTAVHQDAQERLANLNRFHFLLSFPAVFWRENPGFDVIVGNPPWKESSVDEHQFWARFIPGFKYLKHEVRERAKTEAVENRPDLVEKLETEREAARLTASALTSGAFPGMETGNPDLYKAFAWRFHNLLRQEGWLGIVVPRSLFSSKGSAPWRKAVLLESITDIKVTKNENEWLFADVNPGYAVCLLTSNKADHETAVIRLSGPYHSLEEFRYGEGSAFSFSPHSLLSHDPDDLAIPSLSKETDGALYELFINHPRIDSDRNDFCVNPIQELNATTEKKLWSEDGDTEVHKHISIDRLIFNREAEPYTRTNWDDVLARLHEKRLRGAENKRSPYFGPGSPRGNILSASSHPVNFPRIAIRDVVHSSNPRKVWAALVPPRTPLVNAAPHLFFHKGSLEAKAYLLGCLGSSVVDWYGHTKVNLHLNFFILNSICMPEFDKTIPAHLRMAQLAGHLAVAGHDDMEEWLAEFLEIEDAPESREAGLLELEALACCIYGLDEEMVRTVFDGTNPERPSAEDVLALLKDI